MGKHLRTKRQEIEALWCMVNDLQQQINALRNPAVTVRPIPEPYLDGQGLFDASRGPGYTSPVRGQVITSGTYCPECKLSIGHTAECSEVAPVIEAMNRALNSVRDERERARLKSEDRWCSRCGSPMGAIHICKAEEFYD